MKVTELRIGNLIYGVSDRVVTVVGLEDSGVVKAFSGNMKNCIFSYEIDLYSPIPLTEEWLEKLGAIELKPKRGVLKEFQIKTLRIELSNSHHFYYKNSSKIITSVHELQNLYYALKGVELEVKS